MRPATVITHSVSYPRLSYMRRAMTHRRCPGVSVITLALMMLLAGCGVTAGAKTGAKSIPTAAPLPHTHLHWQPMNMPPQSSTLTYILGFAPSNGDVVYACALEPSASQTQLHVWVTRDRSAHWTHLADLTVHAGSNRCDIVVDATDPTTTIVNTSWGAELEIANSTSFITFDSGVSWRQLSGSRPYITGQFATHAGVTYAMVEVDTPSGEVGELVTSDDGLRTWQALPQTQEFGLNGLPSGIGGGVGSSYQGLGFVPSNFWLNPTTGALLTVGKGLWRSDNGGARWTALSTPANLTAPNAQFVVQAPQSGQSWHLCIATSVLQYSRTPSNSLSCSLDGGETWNQRPGSNVAFTNPSVGTYYPPADVFAIGDKGEILATIFPLGTGNDIYRLAPQARQWQAIGASADQVTAIQLLPAPSSDVLWVFSVTEGWQFATYP